MHCRPDGFMLYGKLGVPVFSTSELQYTDMTTRLQIISARPTFYLFTTLATTPT